MSTILHIETSTHVCSAAISSAGRVVASRTSCDGPSHAALLGVFVDELLKETDGLSPDAVAVSSGPGSYTGLRIGVSLAKGLCMGMGIPLIAVPTLKLMAAQVVNEGLAAIESSLLCPMIDARRMEVYAAVYDTNLNCLRDVAADIVEAGTYDDFMNTHKVYFFGNGSDKCRSVITSPNAAFIEGVNPLASGMVSLAESAFEASAFEDVAYFVPFYLKDFQATTPKKLF